MIYCSIDDINEYKDNVNLDFLIFARRSLDISVEEIAIGMGKDKYFVTALEYNQLNVNQDVIKSYEDALQRISGTRQIKWDTPLSRYCDERSIIRIL